MGWSQKHEVHTHPPAASIHRLAKNLSVCMLVFFFLGMLFFVADGITEVAQDPGPRRAREAMPGPGGERFGGGEERPRGRPGCRVERGGRYGSSAGLSNLLLLLAAAESELFVCVVDFC